MTRKKVKLAYITNDSNRKATFKKRKKGLMKKVSELSTLCDVKACAIIYSPYESQPEVWPSTAGAHRVVADFKKLSEVEQGKKMMNQESFLRQRIAKANDQLKKQRKDNREKEMTQVMYQCLMGDKGIMHGLNMVDLNDLGWLVDQNLKEIHKRIEAITKKASQQRQSAINASSSNTAGVIHGGHVVRAHPYHDMNNVVDHKVAPAPAARPSYDHMEAVQRQHQWLMELMNNPQEHVVFGGRDDMGLPPFGETYSHPNLWSNAFFP